MLLNTGTSNNFMTAEVAKSLGLQVRECPESTVILANSMALGSF